MNEQSAFGTLRVNENGCATKEGFSDPSSNSARPNCKKRGRPASTKRRPASEGRPYKIQNRYQIPISLDANRRRLYDFGTEIGSSSRCSGEAAHLEISDDSV